MIDFLALAKRLEEKGCGKCAKDIFVDTLPSESSMGIVLRSSISGDTIDYELPGFMKATFRLIARAANHGIGQEMLQKATDALYIELSEVVGSMNVRICRPITTPMIFPLSNGNLREFSVNMRIIYDELPPEKVEPPSISTTKTRKKNGK